MQTKRRQSTGAPLEDRGLCVRYQRAWRAMSSLAGMQQEQSPCSVFSAPPLLGRARLDTVRGLSVLEQRGSFSVYSQAQVNETFSMPFKTNKDGSNTACYLQHNLTDVSL